MSYTTKTRIDAEFDAVVERTTAALEAEGFGVLCDIDVQGAFAEKLDAEFRQYRILGACAPELAREALDEELELGALLPCNVIVYETDGGEIGVSAVDPERLLSVVDDPALDGIAAEVAERFDQVLERIAAEG